MLTPTRLPEQTMRQLNLREHEESGPHSLSVVERDALSSAINSLAIAPVPGESSAYTLNPGSIVGAAEIDDLSVLIQPKIGIPGLLSLACYAMNAYRLQDRRLFNFKEHVALPDALALALTAAARRAFSRGLLHGYISEEDALHTVRGRIRFDDQIRRRFGVPLPVEVRYDEFTDDILANRLVKAAVGRLTSTRLRSTDARRGLAWIAGTLDNISLVEFPPRDIPEVPIDRLNEHYRDVVAMSRLILRHGAFESVRGPVRASGFLMDMNVVFQEFVTVALREALGVSADALKERTIPSLDQGDLVQLRPDLVWRQGSSYAFVGDAKYKNITGSHVPNADIYQLLAYVTSLDMSGGMLIYAKGEADTATYQVRHSRKRLVVAALDLSYSLDKILEDVRRLAGEVRVLRDEALGLRNAPVRAELVEAPR